MGPEQRSIPKVQEFLLEKEFSVKNLRHSQKATSQLMNIPKVPPKQQALLSPLITEALALIGAGYYTFGVKAKKEYYNQSRAQVGKLLAVVYSGKNKNLYQWANEIEHELLMNHSSKNWIPNMNPPKAYSDCYQLSIQVFHRTKNFPRHLRPTLGKRLEESTITALLEIKKASVTSHNIRKNHLTPASFAMDDVIIAVT